MLWWIDVVLRDISKEWGWMLSGAYKIGASLSHLQELLEVLMWSLTLFPEAVGGFYLF